MPKPAKTTETVTHGDEESIRVFVRVRPLEAGAPSCMEVESDRTVRLDTQPEPRVFTFDSVTGAESTQEQVFRTVGKGVVENCLAGYNGTIFAYGQTGSGKTYSMMGPVGDDGSIVQAQRGIIPRAFEYLFSLIERDAHVKGNRVQHLVQCSFLEIYNERIFDLLDAGCTGKQLRENSKLGVFVEDLTELTVESPSEACAVLLAGSRNRKVAETSMNRESSRSHAVLTMSIKTIEHSTGNLKSVKQARLNLIDLAGSERQKDTNTVGSRLKEAGSINKSLSALGNVMMSLVDVAHGKERHVAYRDSKLTFLLRDSLGGNTKTSILAAVSPAARSFGESLSTLQFMRRAKMIKNKVAVNQDMEGNVADLQDEIRRLKERLSSGAAAGIPAEMASLGPMDASGDSSTVSGLKQLLLGSIATRDQAEQDKALLAETIKHLQELCERKEKKNQSNNMIIKFRDATIAKLEKATKKAGGASTAMEEELRGEVAELKTQLAHHPDVTRFAKQNLELREELKRLQRAHPKDAQENAEVQRLRAYTLQLEHSMREMLGDGEQAPASPGGGHTMGAGFMTPVAKRTRSTLARQSPAFGTPRGRRNENLELEKFKLQKEWEAKLAAAQAALAVEQGEKAREAKQAAQVVMELTAELEGARKCVAELESAMAAMKMRSNIAQAQMHESHMQRITQITSPRKGGGGSSAGGEAEMAKAAALALEIDAMTAKGEAMAAELEQAEVAQRQLRQQVASLEHQLRSTQEAAEEAACDYVDRTSELQGKLQALGTDMAAIQDSIREAESTHAALEQDRDAWASRCATAQAELTQRTAQLEAKEASLDDEAVRLTTELLAAKATLQREISQRAILEDDCETLQAEAAYKDAQLGRLEAELGRQATAVGVATAATEMLQERLAAADATAAQLKAQLQAGSEATAELVRVMDERAALGEQLQEATAALATAGEETNELRREIASLAASTEETERTLEAQRAALQVSQAAVAEQQGQVRELRAETESKRQEVDECRAELDVLSAQLEAARGENAALTGEALELNRQLQDEHDDHERQVREIMGRLEHTHADLAAAKTASNELKATIQVLEGQKETLSDQVTSLSDQITAADAVAAMHEQELIELKKTVSAAGTSDKHARTEMEQLQAQVASYKAQQEKVTAMLAEAEEQREAKNAQIAELRPLAAVSAQLSAQLDQAQQALGAATEALVTERAVAHASTEALKASLADLQTTSQQQLAELMASGMAKDEMIAQLRAEVDELEGSMKAALEDAECLVTQLKNTQELDKKLFKEKQAYRSRAEQLQEEVARVTHKLACAVADNDELRKEHEKLMGHNNTKQKIQLHVQIKRENNILKEELGRVKTRLRQKEDQVDKLAEQVKTKGRRSAGKPGDDIASIAVADKENTNVNA